MSDDKTRTELRMEIAYLRRQAAYKNKALQAARKWIRSIDSTQLDEEQVDEAMVVLGMIFGAITPEDAS